jgi:hypothetical protein
MYGHRLSVIGLVSVLAFVGVAYGAQASPISDIADGVNDALFGGSNLYAAQTVLTAIVMMSAGLFLAMLKMPPAGIFILLFCVLGALTAIGWADITIILVAGLIAAAMFAKTAVGYMTGGGDGAGSGK